MAGLASVRARLTQEAVAQVAARLERLPYTRYQRNIFLIIATAWFFDSVDLGSLTFLLGSIKTFFRLSTAEAGLLSSMSFFGMFLGASIAGMAADRFGRRSIFQVSMLFWGLGSILCGFAPTVDWFLVARVIVGFGMGMEFPIAQSIASEIAPAKHRGRYIALLEGFWPIGFITAGLIAYAILPTFGWRPVFVIEGVPFLFVFIVRRFIPESPRWLADHGYVERAEAVLTEIERNVEKEYGKPLPPPKPIEIQPATRRWYNTFFELWSRDYFKRTVMLWLLWFFALLGYYGLTTWLSALLQQSGYPVTKSVYYTILISLAGVPGFLVSSWLIELAGRRPTIIGMLLGGAVSAYFYGTAIDQNHLIAFGLCMQFCLFGMWSALYAYTPELYPTRARATGTGFASAIGRVGSLLGPYLVGSFVLPTFGTVGVFTCGAGAFVVAALVVMLLGEETKGRIVEEVSR
jgi:MFS transporter, putative metabolite:H+ symporter